MARRVKNQSKSWLEQTREDWRKWRSMIAKHSPQAKVELQQLEEDYQIKPLMEHPERYEGSRTQIIEFMKGLEDLKKGVLREQLRARGGEPESTWKERERAKLKARGAKRKKGVRKVVVKTGTDPKTGEKLAIIERAKKGEREIIEGIKPGQMVGISGTENIIGNVGGVVYKVTRVKTQKGPRYQFNVTKYGRRILPEPGSPPLYNHPDENKLFQLRDDADIRARRVINAALIWFEEHRGQIKERVRIAGHRKKVHEDIQSKRTRKVSKELREAWEKKTGKKSRKRISNPIFGGESEMLAQAKDALSQYKSEFSTFKRTMSRGNPDFGALMRAYDWLENARANLSLAEKKSDARAVQRRKEELRDSIVSMMGACDVEELLDEAYSLNPSKKRSKKKRSKKRSKKNPTAETHQKLGTGFLKKSEKAWEQYCDTLKTDDLLKAYENLVLAEQELGYAKDKKGLAQARDGLKSARAELASLKK